MSSIRVAPGLGIAGGTVVRLSDGIGSDAGAGAADTDATVVI
jgi:hypothetical protein